MREGVASWPSGLVKLRAWETVNFGLPARKRKKMAERWILTSLGKEQMAENITNGQKTFFGRFSFFGPFFPYFAGGHLGLEAKN